jgi:hypothetical protein
VLLFFINCDINEASVLGNINIRLAPLLTGVEVFISCGGRLVYELIFWANKLNNLNHGLLITTKRALKMAKKEKSINSYVLMFLYSYSCSNWIFYGRNDVNIKK